MEPGWLPISSHTTSLKECREIIEMVLLFKACWTRKIPRFGKDADSFGKNLNGFYKKSREKLALETHPSEERLSFFRASFT